MPKPRAHFSFPTTTLHLVVRRRRARREQRWTAAPWAHGPSPTDATQRTNRYSGDRVPRTTLGSQHTASSLIPTSRLRTASTEPSSTAELRMRRPSHHREGFLCRGPQIRTHNPTTGIQPSIHTSSPTLLPHLRHRTIRIRVLRRWRHHLSTVGRGLLDVPLESSCLRPKSRQTRVSRP